MLLLSVDMPGHFGSRHQGVISRAATGGEGTETCHMAAAVSLHQCCRSVGVSSARTSGAWKSILR